MHSYLSCCVCCLLDSMLSNSSPTTTSALSMPEYVSRFKCQLLNLRHKYDIAASRDSAFQAKPIDQPLFKVNGSPIATARQSTLTHSDTQLPLYKKKSHHQRRLTKHRSLPALGSGLAPAEDE